MIRLHAAPVQLFGDRPITVRAHLQSDALNLPAQFDIVSTGDVDKEATSINEEKVFSDFQRVLNCTTEDPIKLRLTLHRSGWVTAIKVDSPSDCRLSRRAAQSCVGLSLGRQSKMVAKCPSTNCSKFDMSFGSTRRQENS